MSDLKPLNGTFTLNVPIAFELRDGQVVSAEVANPEFFDRIDQGNSDVRWAPDIDDEIEALWDGVRQPDEYFELKERYHNAAAAKVYAALRKIGLRR